MKIAIIDYGAGNLQSVANAFKAIGAEPEIIRSPEQIDRATHLVLPGQGEFGDCAQKLKVAGIFDKIKQWIAADQPFLGICVGYQLLFEGSDESPNTAGLGILPGRCEKFSGHQLKVPHMGWNAVTPRQAEHPLWNQLEKEPYFYFVHSYFPTCSDPEAIACHANYGQPFHAAVALRRTVATQFHPEKSQHSGLQFLQNFLNL